MKKTTLILLIGLILINGCFSNSYKSCNKDCMEICMQEIESQRPENFVKENIEDWERYFDEREIEELRCKEECFEKCR